ncbi:MAG TPA: M23 family metallopeptidase [Bacteroidota bacterium]|nr:M23 family metallopeptidase [Bacteroidota bacterium]
MASNRGHHISKENKFQILVIPQSDAGTKRSIALSLGGIIGVLSGLVGFILLLVVLALGYTPLGTLVPVSNAEIQKRYGNQLYDLQTRLSKLSEEVIVIREYNRKLRGALGEGLDTLGVSSSTASDQAEVTPEQGELDTQQAVNEEQPKSDNAAYGYSSQPIVATKPFEAAFPLYPPVVGYVSRGFDEAQRHFGIDYAGRRGSIVSAAADGYIIFAGWTYDDGNMIIISHGSGYFTIYKHNQALLKSANDFVKRGQPIALLGNSGNTSNGPHLHFELWKDGQPLNPDGYLISTESL